MTQKVSPRLISLQTFNDDRGQVEHYSSSELPDVKRLYFVSPAIVGEFRGWHGHKEESKVFRCLEGSFEVYLAQVENWIEPRSRRTFHYQLSARSGEMLLVPGGFANAMISLISGSRMMVLSDKTLSQSAADDFRFDKACFPLA